MSEQNIDPGIQAWRAYWWWSRPEGKPPMVAKPKRKRDYAKERASRSSHLTAVKESIASIHMNLSRVKMVVTPWEVDEDGIMTRYIYQRGTDAWALMDKKIQGSPVVTMLHSATA